MEKEEKEKEIKQLYFKIFKRLERNGNGVMEKGEFFNYLKAILAFNFEEFIGKELPEQLEESALSATYSNYVFKSIDVEGKGYVTFERSYPYVRGIKENDKLVMTKLSFRAIDKDRSRSIKSSEVKEACGIFGYTLNEKKFLDIVGNETKTSDLSFPQYYQLITGEELADKETDPYDGLVEKKKTDQSSCCFLI